jgi:hypothetical protein
MFREIKESELSNARGRELGNQNGWFRLDDRGGGTESDVGSPPEHEVCG